MRSVQSTLAAIALFVAAAPAAARELPRGAAEDAASYACRVQLTPASRSCLARCDATYKAAAQEDDRWSCIQTCTIEHVRAVRSCREDAAATARALVPKGDASDDNQPIAFDASKLTE